MNSGKDELPDPKMGLPFNARDMAKQFWIADELGITMERLAEAHGITVEQLETIRAGLRELEEL
jgi:acetyl-CoA acetyltransferase